jgi:hypothetical protein
VRCDATQLVISYGRFGQTEQSPICFQVSSTPVQCALRTFTASKQQVYEGGQVARNVCEALVEHTQTIITISDDTVPDCS